MIALEGVAVRAGSFRLGPLGFTVGRGEHAALLGASGAGKSVTLEVIAGLRPPETGVVRLRGRDVDGVEPRARRLGWVPQSQGLFPHLSVADNLAYGLRARGVPEPERRRRVGEMAERLGITALLPRRTPSLSGGERQRVALGRALVTGCDLLLLDEPFAALEPQRRGQLWELLAELRSELSLTILHATHDVRRAAALGRVLALAEGKLVHDGGAPSSAELETLGLHGA